MRRVIFGIVIGLLVYCLLVHMQGLEMARDTGLATACAAAFGLVAMEWRALQKLKHIKL